MKIVGITLLALVGGMMALNLLGRFFIQEVIQESTFAESSDAVREVDATSAASHFELPDLRGETIALSDFLGAPVVVTFWTTWNPSATDQIRILDEVARNSTRDLFAIVAISSQEDKSAVNSFMSRGGYEVQVLLDESGAVTEAYQARNLPATYFLDKEGVLREVFIGVLSEQQLVEKAESLLR